MDCAAEKRLKAYLATGVEPSAAEDVSLEEHDKRWHPEGYKDGDACKFREAREKGDEADVLVMGLGGEKPLKVRDIQGEHRVLRMSDVLKGKSKGELAKFLRANRDSYVRMYHGTGAPEVLHGGPLTRSNRTNRRTAQSSSGFVYLAADPQVARRYAEMGYNGPTEVYSVDVKVSELKPDKDSLYFLRRGGVAGEDIGDTLADSIYHTGNARVARDIQPYEMGRVDVEGRSDGLRRDAVATLGNYYSGDLRNLAHKVKDGDANAIAEAGKRLAKILPKNAVLVPMPSHTGKPTTMRDLADAIAANAEGAKVIDALRSSRHESSYEQKKRGEMPAEFEMRRVADIPQGREVYIVDNVIDTGATYGAASRAIRNAKILALADTDKTPYADENIIERRDGTMDSRIDLKKVAQMAIAEDASATVVEVALEALAREGDNPRRAPYPKTCPVGRKDRGVAMDEAPLSGLQKHDKRFHPKGYKEGDSCKYREAMARGDKADELEKAERQEAQGSLSKKKYEDYLRQMKKKHPEIDAERALYELGQITDKKVQADAAAWLLRGAIRLPEDLYKVEQARDLAGKAKVDPLSYDTPQACINDLLGQGHKVSLKPITVEELKKDPLFSDYKKLPMGVETFEVEDSRLGQMRMREVIDTHWGKEANPWCLLARGDNWTDAKAYRSEILDWWYDGGREQCGFKQFDERPDDDELLKLYNEHYGLGNAWRYWNRYNALPKRVAFKDGKLLAFMATDSMDYDEAFDDSAYGSASRLSKMYPDEFKEFEEWEQTEEGQEEGANFCEWLEHNYPELVTDDALAENAPEQWWDRQDSPHDGIPIGNRPVEGDKFGRWADLELKNNRDVVINDNCPNMWHKGTSGKDGYVAWWDNGSIKARTKDGKTQEFWEDGKPSQIEEDDLTVSIDREGNLTNIQNWGGSGEVKQPLEVHLVDGNVVHATLNGKDIQGYAQRTRMYVNDEGKPDFVGTPVDEKSFLKAVDDLVEKAKKRHGKKGKSPVQDGLPFQKTAFLKWLASGK